MGSKRTHAGVNRDRCFVQERKELCRQRRESEPTRKQASAALRERALAGLPEDENR